MLVTEPADLGRSFARHPSEAIQPPYANGRLPVQRYSGHTPATLAKVGYWCPKTFTCLRGAGIKAEPLFLDARRLPAFLS